MNPISQIWLDSRQRRVRETLPNHGLCLDIGAGEHPIFPTTVNLDLDPDTGPHVCGEAHCLPFRDSVFNNIYCNEVIEHFKDHLGFYGEAKRVLKKGGRVAITSPCDHWLWKLIWWGWSNTVGRKWHHTHESVFDPDEMEGFFRVSRQPNINFFLNFAVGERLA